MPWVAKKPAYNDALALSDSDLNTIKDFLMTLPELQGVLLENAATFLNIPTYDGLNQIVHCKVLYFKDGWNGYKFWMGYTPLPYRPAVDESKENPCIAVSNDGETWATPPGLTNPLDLPDAYPNDYHSDTHLVYIPHLNRMELWYRQYIKAPQKEIIWRKISTDGVNWTAREQIMSHDNTDNFMVAPSVIYDENKYKIWFVTKDIDNFYKLSYYESADGLNPTFIRNMKLSNTNLGHADVQRTSRGYEAVIHIRGDQTCEYYFSVDNLNWTIGTTILKVKTGTWNDTKLYRPNITITDDYLYFYYCGGINGSTGARIGLIKIPKISRVGKILDVPTSSTALGKKGDLAINSNYLYLCYDTNSWIRIPKENATW